MRSIPHALLWEMSTRGRWQVPAFFLLGNAMPFLIYSALGSDKVDPNEQSFVIMHVMFLPVMMTQFAVGLLAAQGPLSRLYSAPISTSSLVAWHQAPGAILLALEVAVSLWLQNHLFSLTLPILGPTLFAAAVWASAQVLVSVTHRTFLSFFRSAIPCVAMFLWLSSQYGSWFSQPRHYWTEVTPGSVFFMVCAAGISYALTVAAVTRERCGERVQALKLWTALVRLQDQWNQLVSAKVKPFRSANHAQLWYEWRHKGIALPAGIAMLLSMSGIVFIIRLVALGNFRQQMMDLHEGLLGGGGLLSLFAGVTGFVVGTTSTGNPVRHDNSALRDITTMSGVDQMGHFLATRPMSNSMFASSVLCNAARSVLSAWVMWFVVFLVAVSVARLTCGGPERILPEEIAVWYLPLTLLGAWIATTTTATIALTGRSARFLIAGAAAVAAGIILEIAAKTLASTESQELLFRSILLTATVFIIGGTGIAIVQARRRRLIDRSVGFGIVATWLTLTVLAWGFRPVSVPILALPIIVSFTALVVLPIATAPLAIAWNRHR